MKLILLYVLMGVIVLTSAQKYIGKYDNIDLFRILQNQRMLDFYVACLLDQPKGAICNKEGNYLKEKLPEALDNDCKFCTDKQIVGAYQAINFLIQHKAPIWQKIQMKFDKENEFRQRNGHLLRYIQEHGNHLDEQEFLVKFRHHISIKH